MPDLGDPERWELFVNRKEGVIHRRFGERSLEKCNLDQVSDYMLADEAMLARLLEQGMERCKNCWDDVLADKKVDTV